MADRHITSVRRVDSVLPLRYQHACSCGWTGPTGTYTDACNAATTHYFATLPLPSAQEDTDG